MAVPSANFFKELAFKHNKASELMKKYDNWTEYYDIYNSRYADMHFQFNSWNEMVDIIKMNDTDHLKLKYKNVIKEKMEMHLKENNQKWDEFLSQTIFY